MEAVISEPVSAALILCSAGKYSEIVLMSGCEDNGPAVFLMKIQLLISQIPWRSDQGIYSP